MSEEEKKTRKSGVYISHTGLVYGDCFTRRRNVAPDIVTNARFDILRKQWTHFQMMDHGFNNPTAILFACFDKDGKIIVYDEIYKNKTLVKDLATIWKAKREELDIRTEYVIGDPSIVNTDPLKGSSVQAEYAENGIYIGLGNNDVTPGIIRVQHMFREQQIIITDRCTHLLDELLKYRWDRHITKIKERRNKKEEPLKKDDHALDALRYGVMSRPKAYEEIDEPVGIPHNVARVASDFDWELQERNNQYIDELLGSEV
jgi:phage terminase large subunit